LAHFFTVIIIVAVR